MTISWGPWALFERTSRIMGVLSLSFVLFIMGIFIQLPALPGFIIAPHLGEGFLCCFEVATVFHKPKVPLQWERKLEKFYRGL